jgi:hypothetical protein
MADEAAVLEAFVGTWDAEVTIRPGPGAEPVNQKGVSTNRLIAGKWLVIDYRADGGFQGQGIYGWDPARDCYTGAWVDAALVSIARSEGTWDSASRTLKLVTDTTHQGRPVRYREERQLLDDGRQLYRNLVPMPDGSELELIRMVYRRR